MKNTHMLPFWFKKMILHMQNVAKTESLFYKNMEFYQ